MCSGLILKRQRFRQRQRAIFDMSGKISECVNDRNAPYSHAQMNIQCLVRELRRCDSRWYLETQPKCSRGVRFASATIPTTTSQNWGFGWGRPPLVRPNPTNNLAWFGLTFSLVLR